MFEKSSGQSKRQLIRGIIAIALGIAIMFYPGLTLRTVIMVFGGFLLSDGIVSYLLSRKARQRGIPGLFLIPPGLGNMVFGGVLLIFPTFMVEMFMFLVGIILAITGFTQLMAQLGGRKAGGFSLLYAILAALALFGGIYLLAKPFQSAAAMLTFFGAMVTVYGAAEIFFSLQRKKLMGSQTKQEPQTIDADFEEIK